MRMRITFLRRHVVGKRVTFRLCIFLQANPLLPLTLQLHSIIYGLCIFEIWILFYFQRVVLPWISRFSLSEGVDLELHFFCLYAYLFLFSVESYKLRFKHSFSLHWSYLIYLPLSQICEMALVVWPKEKKDVSF